MRIARFSHDGDVSFGVVEDDTIAQITAHPFAPVEFTGGRAPLAAVKLLAPVLPSKVVAIGKNYAEHAAEMGGDVPESPLIFLKPSTSVVASGDDIASPPSSERVDYEGELAVVVGRLCRDVPEDRAMDVVLGYTCANDVTARDQQKTDGQWSRAKGYDTFCPLGPWIETDAVAGDATLVTSVNGQEQGRAGVPGDAEGVAALIAAASSVMTLLPGDVLLAGGAGAAADLACGDEVSVSIDAIGTLTNKVEKGD